MLYPSDVGKKYINNWAVAGVLTAAIICVLAWFLILKPQDISSIVSPFSKESTNNSQDTNKVMNPLTGEFVNIQDAPWKDYRPLAAMVNNYVDARPQSGLISADLVYEMVAEGGITRYLSFFLSTTPEKIGPIRSTREYYLVLVKELGDAMLMHIGYSPQALLAIENWPVRSLSRGGATFWRDQDRINKGIAVEHTAYVNGKDLRELGDKLGWQGTRPVKAWSFKNDKTGYETATAVNEITIDFWAKGDYSAYFKYNPDTATYLRSVGLDSAGNPIPHKDQETGKQIEIKNLIVQFASESAIQGDEKNRLDYQLVGSGSGLVFLDGKVIDITWSKASRDERTMFYDKNGKEIQFNRGKFWISIVPDRNINQVVYK